MEPLRRALSPTEGEPAPAGSPFQSERQNTLLDIERLHERVQKEGRILWLSEGHLGIFSPSAVDSVDAQNFHGLKIPPNIADALSGRVEEVLWQDVRATVFSTARKLNTPQALRSLYGRMEEQFYKTSDAVDLSVLVARTAARSLVGMVAIDLPAGALKRVQRDQDLRLQMLLSSPEAVPTRGQLLSSAWNEYRIGSAVKDLVRRRSRSRHEDELDFVSGLMPLAARVGVTRTAYVVTTLLTALAGAPGPVAACLAFEMASRPLWRERIRHEMAELQLNDLLAAPARKAPVTHRFVQEVLRLWSFPLIARRAVKRAIKVDGHTLEAGQSYIFSTFLPHRDPDNWPNPDQFDPDRWNTDEARDPGAYVPFGWGVRTCLGAAIGTSQLILLSRLLSLDFDIEFEDGNKTGISLGNIAWPENFRGRIVAKAL